MTNTEEFVDGLDGPDPDHVDIAIDSTIEALQEICRQRQVDLHGIVRAFDQWPEPELVDAQAADKILNLARRSSRAGHATALTIYELLGTLQELIDMRRKFVG